MHGLVLNETVLRTYSSQRVKIPIRVPWYRGKIKTFIIDPPRAGISPKTLRKVIRLKADRMVYVSCNLQLKQETLLP